MTDQERLQLARDVLREWLAERLDRMNRELAPKIAEADGPDEVERVLQAGYEGVAADLDEWLADFTFPPRGPQ